jgi:rhamnosyltransferase subunit B
MANVVMTTHWTGGDVYPFIRIGNALKKHGHRVTLVTHCYYEQRARQAGLEFEPFDTPREWAEFLVDDAKIGNPLNNLQGVLDFRTKYQNEQRYLLEYEKLRIHCGTDDTVLLVRHVDSVAALLLAETMRIPIVTVHMAPSFLSQVANDNEIFGAQLLETLNSVRAELNLPPARSWQAWWNAPKKTIGLWSPWFDTIGAPQMRQVTPVGFALDDWDTKDLIPSEVEAFLAEYQSPILISGGTGKQLKSGFYDACVEACASSNRPALVVTQYEELVPRNLPDNVRWFKFLPLAPLMSRMGAIIHHGGINTCAEALAAALPQVVLGYYYDRPGNGTRLKRLGVADYLPPVIWRPGIVAEALSRLMVDVVRDRCRELALRMRSEDVMGSIHGIIETAAGNQDLMIDSSDFLDSEPHTVNDTRSSQWADAERTVIMDRIRGLSGQQRSLLAQALRKPKEQEQLKKSAR